jgi:hypothetical protein
VVPLTATRLTGDAAAPCLGGQISSLVRHIATANLPGDLDGLFARHVLGSTVDLVWHVGPMTGPWLARHADELEDAGPLAAVGYGMSSATSVSIELSPHVRAGLRRLKQRDLFRAGRLTFLHDSRMLLGIGLAALSVQHEMPDAVDWLAATLRDPRLQPADRFHDLIQQHRIPAARRITPHTSSPCTPDERRGSATPVESCNSQRQGPSTLPPAATTTDSAANPLPTPRESRPFPLEQDISRRAISKAGHSGPGMPHFAETRGAAANQPATRHLA